ncbi:MAG: hypothetical protein AAGE61_02035 [Pseudomonadota bacterium]
MAKYCKVVLAPFIYALMSIFFIILTAYPTFSEINKNRLIDLYSFEGLSNPIFSEKYDRLHLKSNTDDMRFYLYYSEDLEIRDTLTLLFGNHFTLPPGGDTPGLKYKKIRKEFIENEENKNSSNSIIILKTNNLENKGKLYYSNIYCKIYIDVDGFRVESVYVELNSSNRKEKYICFGLSIFSFYGFLNYEYNFEFLKNNLISPVFLYQIIYKSELYNFIEPGMTKREFRQVWEVVKTK